MRDDNTYTRDGEDLDLVTLETERDTETERQGDTETGGHGGCYRKQQRESTAATQ